jgi:hypothetical protein
LTLSSSWDMDCSEFLNNHWFLSFQITQTHKRQISWRKERRALRPPDEKVNWRKWWARVGGSTDDKSFHDLTDDQIEQKILQEINKCLADSMSPHPVTQDWASVVMIPQVAKFIFVGNLSLSQLSPHMKCIMINYPRDAESSWQVSYIQLIWRVNGGKGNLTNDI